MRTLNWNWDRDIKIFDGTKVIGRIPTFLDSKWGIINGKSFFIDRPAKMYRTFISDPTDNKAYCEIDTSGYPECRAYCPAFEYIGELTMPTSWFSMIKAKWLLTNKGVPMAELERTGGFFKDEGILKIFKEENSELVIYTLLYFYSINPG